MAEPATADLIADLLLRHYREPMRYRVQAPIEALAFGNLDIVLRLALGRPVELAPTPLRARASAVELERAAAFYIQQQFFREGATHYEALGLAPDASQEAVRENYRLLMQLIHPDRQGADSEWPESYAARVNRAYGVLKNAETRSDYDRQLAGARTQEAAAAAASARTAAVPVRAPMPRQPAAPRKSPPTAPVLPEWLTAGVGGFVRENPGLSVFAGLTAILLAMVATMVWPEHDAMLPAGASYTSPPPVEAARPGRSPLARPVAPVTVAEAPARSTEAVPSPAPVPAAPQAAPVVTPPVPAPRIAAAPAVAPPVVSKPLPPVSSPAPRTIPQPAPQPVVVAVPPPARPAPVVAQAPTPSPVAPPVPVVAAAATPPPVVAAAPVEPAPVPAGPPPVYAEVEALIASFISSYEGGRIGAFASLFDDDAQTNQQRGRAAIAGEYDQLFRASSWRRMSVAQMRWQTIGDRAQAKGELTMKTGWRDGRESEQRMSVDMEIVRQGTRAVIAKLSMQPR